MKTMQIIALLNLAVAGAVTLRSADLRQSTVAPNHVFERKGQTCFKKVRVSFAQASMMHRSRAGINPATLDPVARVYKDGFSLAGCIKDRMLYEGDAHGDHKHSYAIGAATNVSIVHYSATVPKEDQEDMTHEVCFDFCRTMKNMSFFGINNGRECYCAPFFEATAGDSSHCTEVCDGDAGQFCGGKTKSSVFEMHACNDGPIALGVQMVNAFNLRLLMEELIPKAMSAATGKQALSSDLQAILSKDGNPDASDLMQLAKVSAGKLLHAAEEAKAAKEKMRRAIGPGIRLTGLGRLKPLLAASVDRDSEGQGGIEEVIAAALEKRGGARRDFTDFAVAKQGEDAEKLLEKLAETAQEKLDILQQLFLANEPEINGVFHVVRGSCVVDDAGCVMTSSYTDGNRSEYLNREYCEIQLPPKGADVVYEKVSIEPRWDSLIVNGIRWTGMYPDAPTWKASEGAENHVKYRCESGNCPDGETLAEHTHVTGKIIWKTDSFGVQDGFKICAATKEETKDNAIQYYPLMYFADKSYLEAPTTCTGTVVGEPIYYKSVHSCAAACDAAVGECVGFSYYPDKALANNNGPNICFLFSSIKKATYYTGCNTGKSKAAAFLQQRNSTSDYSPAIEKNPDHPVCGLKLSKFVGTTIKPNPSGKCPGCLKTLTRADRCYKQ
eukprot:TRINITY_DN5601_c0_g1_i2.p1 TRINITY_DN5601_c0_g1~~TRINITY_DN5601_c0_g1_i2.p1  ORF type:complete len:668 (+),score=146.16 TRINITY_DN5601_c0_g1_i2:75-2078(+)